MKTHLKLLIVATAVATLSAVWPAGAHHNMVAQFSLQDPVTLRGKVTKLEWVNPHAWIYVDVEGADGQVENWAVETGSPLRMRNRGLTETDFLFGTQVIIGGFKARDGSRQAAGWIVTFPDREGVEGEEASFPLGR